MKCIMAGRIIGFFQKFSLLGEKAQNISGQNFHGSKIECQTFHKKDLSQLTKQISVSQNTKSILQTYMGAF